MADTLNFGPEWLRALSGGNNEKTSLPIISSCKYKLAENRYGREEMLALYSNNCKIPEPLTLMPSIVVEKARPPMSLSALSEEEQHLISTSMNSQAVLRVFGRGEPPTRVVERGRGRGRGRGEGFPLRTSYEEGEGGFFGRSRGPSKNDAWEEIGSKRFDRNFSSPFEEVPQRKELYRSQSSDNWREREQEQEKDNDGDWQRAGPKWNARTSWRDPGVGREKGGYEVNWQNKQQKGPFTREKSREIYRSRIGESWDDEEIMPEWNKPDCKEIEELGSFDSSGAFVSNKAREKRKENVNSVTDPPILKDDSVSEENNVEGDEEQQVDKRPEVSLHKQTTETIPIQKQEIPSVTKENALKKTKIKNNESGGKSRTVCADNQNNVDADRHKHVTVVREIKHPLHEGAPGMPSRKRDGNLEVGAAAALNNMEETVRSMVAQMTARNCVQDEEKAVCTALPMDHENAMKWFYRDPQEDLQGPFNSSEMAEWFSAGYFTMNLMVKRGFDEKFSLLGELIKQWGRVPFVPGPSMPPLLNNPPPPPSMAVNQQEQLKLLQQQFFIQQQVMTQQFFRQMQMQQIQQIMSQLQENEDFKSLPPIQQQHLAMQCLMGQQLPNAAKLSRLSPTEMAAAVSSNTANPAFHRSHSQPTNISQGKSEEESVWNTDTSVSSGNLSLPTSVWDLDNQQSIAQIPEDMQAQMDKLRKNEEAEQKEEKLKDLELQQKKDELRSQEEEIQRQREAVEREQVKLEKFEMHRSQEARKKEEQQRRIAEEQKMRKMEELRKRQEGQRKKNEEQKQQQEQEMRRKREEEIRQQQEEMRLRQQQEEMRLRQQEEMRLRQQQEEMKLRQQQEEMRLRQQEDEMRLRQQQEEELRQQQEEELRQQQQEEELRQQQQEEELRQQQEEELRQQQEEKMKQQQEEKMRKQQEEKLRKEERRKKREELRHKEEIRKQQEQEELKRQELEKKQQMEKDKQLDIQRNQEMQKQQQEALRKLQQEQLAKLQLPANAQWGSQSHQNSQPQQPTLSLIEIQQQEERTCQQEEQIQRQVEIQRQQMLAIQEQQQQQQQKTWAAQRMATSQKSAKSLLEIQEEQAQQLQQEQSLQKEKKQHQVKNTNSVSTAWSGSSGFNWVAEGWSSSMPATENNQILDTSSQSLGFWDDAVQSASKKSSGKTNNNVSSSEFPSLGSSVRTSGPGVTKPARASRSNKNEEAVQRLFQTKKPEDSFTQWCTNSLSNLATSVDALTFVAFLQEIESPYEVNEYVRSYLGESKAARDFGKQFLEKRNELCGRQKCQSEENSMPSLAEAFAQPTYRQPQQSYEPETQKGKGRKKKKMTKMDSSALGFTVQAAPNRINIGEIDTLDSH